MKVSDLVKELNLTDFLRGGRVGRGDFRRLYQRPVE